MRDGPIAIDLSSAKILRLSFGYLGKSSFSYLRRVKYLEYLVYVPSRRRGSTDPSPLRLDIPSLYLEGSTDSEESGQRVRYTLYT